MADGADTIDTDGRSLRRARNRDAVLDAVITCFQRGELDPSMDEVAKLAGVSNRSIYRYFDDRDHLIRAAVSHALRQNVPVTAPAGGRTASFVQRVERFVDQRLETHRRLAPIARAAKLAAVSEPIVAEEFEAERLMTRAVLLEYFAVEFDRLAPSERDRVAIAVELAFQLDAIDFVASATLHHLDEIRAVLVGHLHRCLAPAGDDRAGVAPAIPRPSVRSGAESY